MRLCSINMAVCFGLTGLLGKPDTFQFPTPPSPKGRVQVLETVELILDHDLEVLENVEPILGHDKEDENDVGDSHNARLEKLEPHLLPDRDSPGAL
jgi:hypothetical protein